MTMAARSRLLTLGGLRLIGPDGAEEPSLATRRRKLALLTLLAIARRPLSRDRLVEMFWGDQTDERARHSLSDALSHLRRVLGPEAITSRRAEVELNRETALDVDLLELAAAATGKDWPRVVSLYEGPFLEAVHVGGSPAWEDWVAAQREGARRLFETAAAAECAAMATRTDWTALEALSARVLEHAALDATAATQHLTAIVRGDEPAPLRARRVAEAYEALSRRALRDYGKEPAPEVRALKDRLVAELSASARAAASQPAEAAVPPLSVVAVSGEVVEDVEPASPPAAMPPVVASTRDSSRLRRLLGLAAILLAGVIVYGTLRPRAEAAATVDTSYLTTRSSQARALMRRIARGSEAGVDRAKALELTAEALAIDPDFAMAHRQLGLLLAGDATQQSKVAKSLGRAAELAPTVTPYERALILSSYHLLVTGDYSQAAEEQRKLLRLVPNDPDAWHELGMTYQYLGDNARAADAYRESLRRDPTSAATWLNRIDALYASGDADGAVAALDSMSREIPGHSSVFAISAAIAAATGDLAEAERQVRAYLASSPDNARRQAIGEMMLSRVLWTAGRHDAGDAALRRGLKIQLERGDSSAALREAIALATVSSWRDDDPARVQALIREALTLVPLSALPVMDRPYLELATVQAIAGQGREARASLEEYERLLPVEARRRQTGAEALARGTLALHERRIPEAITELERASTPDCQACGLAELGLAYEARGQRELAERAYHAFLDAPTLRRTDLLDALHRRWVSARVNAVSSGIEARRPRER